jgi:hypothetical protein
MIRLVVMVVTTCLLMLVTPAFAGQESRTTEEAFGIHMPCSNPSRKSDQNGKVTLACDMEGASYMLMIVVTEPGTTPDTNYDYNIERLSNVPGFRLRSTNSVRQNGLTGREVLLDQQNGQNGVIRARVFVSGELLFALTYLGPANTENDPAVMSFFDSFKVN